MYVKYRCILGHKLHKGMYLNRRGEGLTNDPDAAIRFKDEAEASEWLLNARYAPKDTENYEYVTLEITTVIKEVETNEYDHRGSDEATARSIRAG